MSLAGDSYGRYAVGMNAYLYETSENYPASFYVTSMNATQIEFRGLCTSGEGYSGSLSTSGEVSGTYYNLLRSEPGGTFECWCGQ